MPLQAYLFAKIVTVFQLSGHELVYESQHWSLRFLYLAIGVGVAYFIVGWSCKALEVVTSYQPTRLLSLCMCTNICPLACRLYKPTAIFRRHCAKANTVF